MTSDLHPVTPITYVGLSLWLVNASMSSPCLIFQCIMLLDDDRRRDLIKNFDVVCQAEGFGKSTWTVDLCYLLKRYTTHNH